MNETYLGTLPLIGIIILAVAAWFYMLGGRSKKWRRRFIGSLLCATALWVEYFLMGMFKWLLLTIYPLTIGTFSLGYGSDFPPTKILKRSVVVTASLTASIGICLLYGGKTWLLLPVEVVIASVTVYLGVKNPIYAAPEEFFICLFLWSPKLMYPFIYSASQIS